MTRETAQLVSWLVQQAIYQVLTGDEALAGLVTGVYDDVPEDAVAPYVTLGEAWETPANTLDRFGRLVTAQLHVWSRQPGMAEAMAIANRVVGLLDHQTGRLPVSGHTILGVWLLDAVPQRDPDPAWRHVPVRLRIQAEQQQ